MTYEWKHNVSADWLKARRNVLTATELVELRSKLKRMTKAQEFGKEIHPAFAAVYGMKHELGKPDTASYGAAARGHIMEPYAVEEFNRQCLRLEPFQLYHWDDTIIVNDGLGFSPDAMDIEMTKDTPICLKAKQMGVKPKVIGEVKCYDVKHHYQCITSYEDKVPERYQIAAAMLVCPSIELGYLIFYCPKVSNALSWIVYTRSQLKKEMEELERTWEIWLRQKTTLDNRLPSFRSSKSEDEIYQETMASPLML